MMTRRDPSVTIVDKVHTHRTRALIDALETAAGARRQPLHISITMRSTRRVYVTSSSDPDHDE